MPVTIVRADYDWWYELIELEGDLEEDDEPELNADGHVYYYCFSAHPIDQEGRIWPSGEGGLSVEEAKRGAEARLPSPVEWES